MELSMTNFSAECIAEQLTLVDAVCIISLFASLIVYTFFGLIFGNLCIKNIWFTIIFVSFLSSRYDKTKHSQN